jgi:hypothetical protein
MVQLIESSGLTVNWSKVAGPARKLIFLGVDIDCATRSLWLPAGRLLEVKG